MIREDLSTATDMELVFPRQTVTVPYSTFMGAQPDMDNPVVAQQVADSVRDWIYTQTDEVIRLNQLSQDDPDRQTDPAHSHAFWRGSGGQAEIVYRALIISVAWDGERFQYSFRAF